MRVLSVSHSRLSRTFHHSCRRRATMGGEPLLRCDRWWLRRRKQSAEEFLKTQSVVQRALLEQGLLVGRICASENRREHRAIPSAICGRRPERQL
ncbi:hypothetical protein MTO96_015108 [Rhipicephalus appendiculatus]